MRIAVIIPAFNEEKTIGSIVKDVDAVLKSNYDDYEILVMNDCSTDRTFEVVARLRNHNLKVFTNKHNLGKTKTVLEGFKISDADVFSFIDADYQYDPQDLPAVIDKVVKQGFDICSGIRQNRQNSHYRLFMSKCFNAFNRIMFGIRVKDVNCGMKAIRRSVFGRIQIEYLNAPWFIDTELLAKAYRKGLKITEVPIRHHSRKEGSSKVSGIKLAFETLFFGARLKAKLILGRCK